MSHLVHVALDREEARLAGLHLALASEELDPDAGSGDLTRRHRSRRALQAAQLSNVARILLAHSRAGEREDQKVYG